MLLQSCKNDLNTNQFEVSRSKTDTRADWEGKSISTKWPHQPMNSPPQTHIWSLMCHVSWNLWWYADLTASETSQLISPLHWKIDCSNSQSCSLEGLSSSSNVCAAGTSRNSRPLEWDFCDPDLWNFSLSRSWAKVSVSRSTRVGHIPFHFLLFWVKCGTTARVTTSPCLGLSTTRARSFWYRLWLVILTQVTWGRDSDWLSLCSHSQSTLSITHMPWP